MSLNSKTRFVAIVLGGLGIALSAQAALSSAGPSTFEFRAVGPAGLTINGEGSGLVATEAGGIVTLVVPLTELKTGISLRDDHLKKALEVTAHPKANLAVERSKLTFPADNKEFDGSAVGQLTLHGVTKPSKFTYKVKRTGSDYHVQARLEVDITQFNMEVPCYLGVCVDKNVKVKTAFKVRDN